jgi:aspartyl-tRNA(Asn)/glutamyl-tRNA(Gln) amidotransferase subunit B
LEIDGGWVERVRLALPELPDARAARFVAEYGLPEYDAEVLTARKDLADYFEQAVAAHGNAKAASNWVMGDVLRVVRERKLDQALVIERWPVSPEQLGGLIALIDDGTISGKIAKGVFDELVDSDRSAAAIVEQRGLSQVSDAGELESVIDGVLAGQDAKIAEYRAGKEKMLGFFVGQVMKATQGKANPQMVNEILRKRLN